MNFSYWMVLAAALLPYVLVAFGKSGSGYDNRAPRPYSETLTGWRQRAEWAHRNHFEAFPPFAAAVIIANLAGEPQNWLNGLAGGFVVLRILYSLAYLTDKASLRSLLFMLGLACVVALFVRAAMV